MISGRAELVALGPLDPQQRRSLGVLTDHTARLVREVEALAELLDALQSPDSSSPAPAPESVDSPPAPIHADGSAEVALPDEPDDTPGSAG